MQTQAAYEIPTEIPTEIAKQIICFLKACRTANKTTPEDSKIYADLEIEIETRTVKN
jgi:hypothetical protein